VVAAYPAPIRNWISRHGGLRQRPIFLRGRELICIRFADRRYETRIFVRSNRFDAERRQANRSDEASLAMAFSI
jgi:hypothetical protein